VNIVYSYLFTVAKSQMSKKYYQLLKKTCISGC